ncbi:F0F1 ATP synthase subunit B, partial [Mycobacterium tuberculosis]
MLALFLVVLAVLGPFVVPPLLPVLRARAALVAPPLAAPPPSAAP